MMDESQFHCGRGERFFSSSKTLRPLCDPPSLLFTGYTGSGAFSYPPTSIYSYG